jgi:glycosyltransferase involved in cell wall biosynthesis
MMAKILLVTDAWKPQVNGVVTTLVNLVDQARLQGDVMYTFHPHRCKIRFPLPQYPEIVVGVPNPLKVLKLLKKQKWDHIHIATPESILGITFAKSCRKLKIPFSTSCHTKFPEFVNAKYPWIKTETGWKFMNKVYRDSTHILTTTESMKQELIKHGFKQNIYTWTRGVDRTYFKPMPRTKRDEKILLCVSRVSKEKGLDDFCKLTVPNTRKILVGDGPYLKELKRKYKDVEFTGKMTGHDLARYYQEADVFVFPSLNDTFGVVQIESLACGTPIVAYPVTGPIDVVQPGVNGYLSNNLEQSINQAYLLDRQKVYESSLLWTWENCYKQFKEILLPAKI